MHPKPYFRLRHLLQQNEFWWRYFTMFHAVIRPAVVDNLLKLFACGTPDMGWASYRCAKESCYHLKRICFSCKSRFCSSCGNKATTLWVQQLATLLPITPWQHVTFTFPCEFWSIVAFNRDILNHLSGLAAQSCLNYCKKRGVTPGIFTVLHTHGRHIGWHPHIHLSITLGGLTTEGCWVEVSFSQKALMKCWRYQIIHFFRKYYSQVKFPDKRKALGQTYQHWNTFLNEQYKRDWHVHLAKPTRDHKHTMLYFSRYLKRPAISYSRIKHYDGDSVTYVYRSHTTNKLETVKFKAMAFVQRITQHIHDRHFRVARYYGFLANRCRGTLLPKVFAALKQTPSLQPENIRFADMLKALANVDPHQCILCGGKMLLTGIRYGKSFYTLRSNHKALATMRPCRAV